MFKKKENPEVEKERFVFVDEQQARIDAMRKATGFAKARSVIKWLKEQNLPLWWDILWDSLQTGHLLDKYQERWAKENYLNIRDVETRNQIREKFAPLADPYDQYRFPQWATVRQYDGSFEEVDREAILQYCLRENTYSFTLEEKEAIENVSNFLSDYGLGYLWVRDMFFTSTETGRLTPDWALIGKRGLEKKEEKIRKYKR